ncbi:ABC transporter permease [Ammoniphilus sp. YIM 78166]|uniref:ABC transporter permease n=1 Tax=Ammoniphilus sp. YIM 78166 TaxID=1644106 RepID=UPI00106F2B30|nr:ABC transporter permease [Ammoniphilus sp. YIM 78166]
MKAYIVKRILSLLPVLFVVSTFVFLIIHITPGDPAAVMLGDEATPQEVQALREEMGLNEPIYKQYAHWVGNVLQGDLGYSYYMKESVSQAIFNRLGPTLSLAIFSQILAIVIAIPIGIVAAQKRGSITDQSLMSVSLLGLSIPSFLLSLFLVLLFTVTLKWLPVAGYKPLSEGLWNHLRYLIIPGIALGAINAALISRMTRSSMLEVLNANYIKTARSKGVKERVVIYRHALKNAFIPILTVIGQTFASLVAGSAILETIFNIPGIGQLIINSVTNRDYAVLQGAVLFVTVTFVFINLIIDLLYAAIDPRVRLNR